MKREIITRPELTKVNRLQDQLLLARIDAINHSNFRVISVCVVAQIYDTIEVFRTDLDGLDREDIDKRWHEAELVFFPKNDCDQLFFLIQHRLTPNILRIVKVPASVAKSYSTTINHAQEIYDKIVDDVMPIDPDAWMARNCSTLYVPDARVERYNILLCLFAIIFFVVGLVVHVNNFTGGLIIRQNIPIASEEVTGQLPLQDSNDTSQQVESEEKDNGS